MVADCMPDQLNPAPRARGLLAVVVGLHLACSVQPACAAQAGVPPGAQATSQASTQSAAAPLEAPAAPPPAQPTAAEKRGQRLYETGLDATGRALVATRVGAGAVARNAVACVSCHRPSTVGGIEGGLLVPPISGAVLFAAGKSPSVHMNMQWMRHQTRSAYSSTSFARALTHGTDPDGRPLGPEMPRYAISAQEAADLEAYLRARGQEPVPGLVGGVLHVATVFTPDAPPARHHAVMQVMKAWAADLKLGTVPVRWHAWVLQGPPAGWPAQLQALQLRTPVFGLVSGAGGAQWQPVQDFCELQRVACVFPSVDRLPQGAPISRYAVYLSAAVDGEAHMLARALALLAAPAVHPAAPVRPAAQAVATHPGAVVQQIWRGPAAEAAAQVLMRSVAPPWRLAQPLEWKAQASAPPAEAVAAGAMVVLWLGAEDATAWLKAQRPGQARQVYLSSQLAPAQAVQVPAAWRPYVKWMSMRAAPTQFYGVLAATLEPWAQTVAARADVSAVEFADARAAAFLFGDAAGLTQGVLRPDYLIERLETSVQQRPAASIYMHASLGPGQRVASKGGYLLGFRAGVPGAAVVASPYLAATP